jgi:hypothetical protein
MGKRKIIVKIGIPAYNYLHYLEDAVKSGEDFKYNTVYQIGARFSGKTGAGSVAVVRAVIEAWRQRRRLVVYLFRMRHKDVKESV